AGYAVYRGTSPGFTPSPANRIGTPSNPSFDDASYSPGVSHYKVSVLDRHGNESPYAAIAPSQFTGVPGSTPAVSFLGNMSPNPMVPGGTIELGLARAGRVTMVVYDARGRRVRSLLDTTLDAGVRRVEWNGRDDGDRRLGPGVYLVRVEGPGIARSRKVVLAE